MVMRDPLETRLIQALKSVDAHGDVAPAHVHDPMTMLLRENTIQAHLVRWDDVRGRYVLTGTGRRRSMTRSRHGNLRGLRSGNSWRRSTDATIRGRLVYNAHRIELTGDSLCRIAPAGLALYCNEC